MHHPSSFANGDGHVARSGARRLVVCTDGTWNDPAKDEPTNVYKIARAVQRTGEDGSPQVVYYHAGVGTGTDIVDRVIGGATGLGISKNIRDAYNFLMLNYQPDDQIFLFGFSRGAYTARSLAGLIRNAGILRPERGHLFRDAYELYRNRDRDAHPDAPASLRFRADNAYPDARIHFIGVWDTVGSLGVPLTFGPTLRKLIGAPFGKKFLYEFHDVGLSSFVDHAYHAVAIDEKREPFRPTLWTVKPDSPRAAGQSFEQRWFRGVHSNVGGGYAAAGLSDAALLWMAEAASRHGLGLDVGILYPEPTPSFDAAPASNQKILYRALAIAKKAYASTIAAGMGPDEIEAMQQVDWWGNYHRPGGERFVGPLAWRGAATRLAGTQQGGAAVASPPEEGAVASPPSA